MKCILAKLLTLSFLLLSNQFVRAEPPSNTFEKRSFDGVWRTQDYGYIIEIEAPRVKVYEITNISCLESGLVPGEFVQGDKVGFSAIVPGFIDAFMEVSGEISIVNRNVKIFQLRSI